MLAKRAFNGTDNGLGLNSTAALTVLMKRFVDDGDSPFEVRRCVPTAQEFAAEMDARYARMRAGEGSLHDLIEA